MTMDWLTETPIAHQGLHSAESPENTVGAFEAAVEAGYPIECDIVLTRDGVPIVFHDQNLRRLTGRDIAIEDVDWADIRDLQILDSDEGIPRLADLLETVDGRVPLMIELKSRAIPGDLEPAVAVELDGYQGEFVITSFNPLTLGWFRRHRPNWPRGQIGGFLQNERNANIIEKSIAKELRGDWYCKPDFIAYQQDRLEYEAVAEHRGAGRPILAWTLTSQAEADAVDGSADNIIFENFHP